MLSISFYWFNLMNKRHSLTNSPKYLFFIAEITRTHHNTKLWIISIRTKVYTCNSIHIWFNIPIFILKCITIYRCMTTSIILSIITKLYHIICLWIYTFWSYVFLLFAKFNEIFNSFWYIISETAYNYSSNIFSLYLNIKIYLLSYSCIL